MKVSKTPAKEKAKKEKRKSMVIAAPQADDDDDDGGRTIKGYYKGTSKFGLVPISFFGR